VVTALMIVLTCVGCFGALVAVRVRQDRLDAALFQAIEHQQTDRAIELLKQGANPNAEKWEKSQGNLLQRTWALLRGSRGNKDATRPMFACWNGEIIVGFGTRLGHPPEARLIRALLEHGADPNRPDAGLGTPLQFYTEYDKLECVAILLEQGADPNYCPDIRLKAPPLSLAASSPDPYLVRLLLAHYANPTTLDAARQTPLMYAAEGTWVPRATFDMLFKVGQDLNTQDEKGMTALMLAAEHDHDWKVKLLLEAGADPTLRRRDGRTARDIAKAKAWKDIVKLLDDWTLKHKRVRPARQPATQ
jgi:ankyrin repeat protein